MRPFILHITAALVVLCFSSSAHADLNKDCTNLLQSLTDCTPFECQYEKAVMSGSDLKVIAKYEILGTAEENSCHYKVTVDDKPMLDCKLSAKSKALFNNMLTMQFDGSFQREQKKLIKALKNGNLDGVDQKFIEIGTKLRAIMIAECGGQRTTEEETH